MKKLNFDFSCLPKWAKWIAMDANGHWYWYGQRPDIMYQMAWDNPYGIAGLIPKEYKPIFNGNWKDSLFEVPLRQ